MLVVLHNKVIKQVVAAAVVLQVNKVLVLFSQLLVVVVEHKQQAAMEVHHGPEEYQELLAQLAKAEMVVFIHLLQAAEAAEDIMEVEVAEAIIVAKEQMAAVAAAAVHLSTLQGEFVHKVFKLEMDN